MGKQGDMKFIGTQENLIFYKWKEVYAVRTKPTTVKQTAASIAQSKLFGVAAHAGAMLRSLLKPVLPDAKDRNMMRRFERAIVQWLRSNEATNAALQNNLPFITGFEFNEKSLLQNRLKQMVTVTVKAGNILCVLMPALQPTEDIAAPAGTTAVAFNLRIAACSLFTDDAANAATKTITVAYNNNPLPAQEIELPVAVDAGMIAVIVLSLNYVVNGNITRDMRWLPAGVAGSAWGG